MQAIEEQSIEEQSITLSEAAQRLNVPRSTLYCAVRRGQVPCQVRFDGYRPVFLVKLSDLQSRNTKRGPKPRID